MPVLQTEVGIRPALSLSKEPQAPQSFKAIWDTGCTMTSISPGVADIMLPNAVGVLDVNVSQAKNIQGADLLIGMDIIDMGDMAVTNANAATCFSFRFPPAMEHIDYAKDAQAMEQRGAREGDRAHDRQNLLRNLKQKPTGIVCAFQAVGRLLAMGKRIDRDRGVLCWQP